MAAINEILEFEVSRNDREMQRVVHLFQEGGHGTPLHVLNLLLPSPVEPHYGAACNFGRVKTEPRHANGWCKEVTSRCVQRLKRRWNHYGWFLVHACFAVYRDVQPRKTEHDHMHLAIGAAIYDGST